MSTVFKRFEIWILFALIFAGLWWAFQAEPISEVAQETDQIEKIAAEKMAESREETLIEVRKVDLKPTEQGTVMELTLFGRSGTEEPVELGDANLELLTSEGEGIHRFYVPFDPDPLLSSDEKSLVTLKYWLKTPVDVLWLTYRDQTLKVEIPVASI